jgi:hypothetical protein
MKPTKEEIKKLRELKLKQQGKVKVNEILKSFDSKELKRQYP